MRSLLLVSNHGSDQVIVSLPACRTQHFTEDLCDFCDGKPWAAPRSKTDRAPEKEMSRPHSHSPASFRPRAARPAFAPAQSGSDDSMRDRAATEDSLPSVMPSGHRESLIRRCLWRRHCLGSDRGTPLFEEIRFSL
jgi:hypothetical protein